MAQKSVEILIGKLATDEEFRARFAADRAKTLADFAAEGHDLTACEKAALLSTDVSCCERFAAAIDPRIQKASLKPDVRRRAGSLLLATALGASAFGARAERAREEPPATGAPRVAAPGSGDHPLSLATATARALARNHEIAIEYETVRIVGAGVSRAESAYEPALRLEARYRDHTDPVNSVISGAPAGEEAPRHRGFFGQAVLSQLLPTGASVSLSSGVSHEKTDSTFAILSPYDTTAFGIDLRQPLLRSRAIDPARRAIRVARHDRARSAAALERTVLETVANVERAYWTVVAARREVEIRRKNVALAEEQRTETSARIEAGTLPESDVAQPVAEVARRKGELYASEEGLTRAELALKTLLLDDPADALWNESVLPTDAPEPEPAPFDLVAAIHRAEAKRPELAEAEELVRRREAELLFAKDSVLPALDLVASYGRRGLAGSRNDGAIGIGGLPPTVPEPLVGGLGRSLGTVGENRFPDASLGLALSLPIGNGAAKADVVIADAARRQAGLALSRTRQLVAVDVRNAFLALQTAAQRIEAARAGRSAAETQLGAERERFGVGLTTNFFVLTRQNELSRAEVTETAALADYRRALTDLLRATGTLLDARDVRISDSDDAPGIRAGGGIR